MRAEPYGYQPRQPVAPVDGGYIPINDLNMFNQKWTIRARVSSRTDMKIYNNAKGEGKLFSVDLVDKDGGEIRATFFQKSAEKFFPILKPDNVYSFSRGIMKSTNKKFNNLRHPCELNFNEDAQIIPLDEDAMIPKRTYNFVTIDKINSMQKGDTVDVLGVVIGATPIGSIVLKTGEPRDKRDVTLVDSSGYSIELTLWGEEKCRIVDDQMISQNSVLAIKGGKVDEFQGRKLGTFHTTLIEANPDIPEVPQLIRWYREQGSKSAPISMRVSGGGQAQQDRWTLAQLQAKVLAPSAAQALDDKGMYFNTVATLHRLDTDRKFFWNACPECSKKVQDLSGEDGGGGDTAFFCTSCNKPLEKPTKKYIINVELKDSTDTLKCVAIGDHGKTLVGYDCDTVDDARDHNTPDGKSQIDFFIWRQCNEFVFKLGAKNEVYNDEKRIKWKIFGAEILEADVIVREAQSKLALVGNLLGA
eukprot:GHVO01064303.1.p1 GENE.GHVO01064303.1~~GHVO01064303.1.p1  ORF type:complete len:473 (+),score=72.63 GHVO01064303.1:463-1881(+)